MSDSKTCIINTQEHCLEEGSILEQIAAEIITKIFLSLVFQKNPKVHLGD